MNIEENRKGWEAKGWMKWHEAKIGHVIKIEIWGPSTTHSGTLGEFALYREDTGEIVREDFLPNDETLADHVHNQLQALRNKGLIA